MLFMFNVPFRVRFWVGFFFLIKKGSFLSIAMNTDVKLYFNSAQ